MDQESGKSFQFKPIWGAVAALTVAVALAGGYAIHEHTAAQKLSAENTQMTTALQEIEYLTKKSPFRNRAYKILV